MFNRPATPLTPTPALSGKIVRYSSQAFFTNSNATCSFSSVQEAGFDGVIYLYSGAFDPANPSSHLVKASDNGTAGRPFLVDHRRRAAGEPELLPGDGRRGAGRPGDVHQLRLVHRGDADPRRRRLDALVRRPLRRAAQGPLPHQRHLEELRSNVSGVGTFVPLGSEDSGILWFFSPSNFEVMIKIVDGCSLNNRYWVFFAALTNVEFHVTVLRHLDGHSEGLRQRPRSLRRGDHRQQRLRDLPLTRLERGNDSVSASGHPPRDPLVGDVRLRQLELHHGRGDGGVQRLSSPAWSRPGPTPTPGGAAGSSSPTSSCCCSSPIVGAMADESGRKKVFLFVTYLFCVCGTAALWFVTPGDDPARPGPVRDLQHRLLVRREPHGRVPARDLDARRRWGGSRASAGASATSAGSSRCCSSSR